MKQFFHSLLILSLFSIFLDASVTEITDRNHYNQTVLNNSQSVVVQFAAQWCGVCQAVKEPFNEIAQDKEFKNISFVRVDIDRISDISQENKIVGVPTFLYVQNGKVVGQEIGVQDMGMFKDDVRNHMRLSFNMPKNTQTTDVEHDKKEDGKKSSGIIGSIKNFFASIFNMFSNFWNKIVGLFK